MKMQLIDRSTVLLPLTPTGTGGAVLIHATTITHAMREYFEMLWKTATPIGGVAAACHGWLPTDILVYDLVSGEALRFEGIPNRVRSLHRAASGLATGTPGINLRTDL